jgi:HPt (histidine-containing phosphotransfer) domain-containing protein
VTFDAETVRLIISSTLGPAVLLIVYILRGERAKTAAETGQVKATAKQIAAEADNGTMRVLLAYAERLEIREAALQTRLTEVAARVSAETDALRAEINRIAERNLVLRMHNRLLVQQVAALGAVPVEIPPEAGE